MCTFTSCANEEESYLSHSCVYRLTVSLRRGRKDRSNFSETELECRTSSLLLLLIIRSLSLGLSLSPDPRRPIPSTIAIDRRTTSHDDIVSSVDRSCCPFMRRTRRLRGQHIHKHTHIHPHAHDERVEQSSARCGAASVGRDRNVANAGSNSVRRRKEAFLRVNRTFVVAASLADVLSLSFFRAIITHENRTSSLPTSSVFIMI